MITTAAWVIMGPPDKPGDDRSGWGWKLKAFDDRHVGETAAFAHRLQAPLLVAVLERIQKRRHQLGAGGAERVAERDGAAMDVEARRIGAGVLEPRHGHRREGFVDLEQIDVVDLHAGLFEGAL